MRAPGTQLATSSLKQLHAAIQGFVEGLLLHADDFLDVLLFLANLRKNIAHRLRQHSDQLVEERIVKAQRAAVSHGAAQNPAQHIIPVGVARQNAVGNGKAQRADMIGDDAKGDVDLLLFGVAGRAGLWERRTHIVLPLSFSSASKIGRKMSVS